MEPSGPHDAPPARQDALKLEGFLGRLGRGCWCMGVAPDKTRQGCCRGGFLLYCPCSFLSHVPGEDHGREVRTALQVAFLGEYPIFRREPNSQPRAARGMPRPPGETLGAFVLEPMP